MTPGQLRRCDEERLRTLHRNCLLNLDHPERGGEAEALLEDIHREFARRADKGPDSFLPMLACVGYNVRWGKLEGAERRRLLDWILASDLPRINDAAFMARWGEPGSPERRRCLYETILGYRRQYGVRPGMAVADARWRADLAWLRGRTPA